MKRLLNSSLVLALLAATLPAWAGPTSIATLPILNIEGTGTVKPNLMLLYDNSGSMAWNYTPDYVDDSGSCRSRATLANGVRGCRVGDPPFNSPDFNKQYYNPKVRYTPPVKADGTSYPSQTRAETDGWKSVTTDIYGKDRHNMENGDATTTNLLTGFPDLRWCAGDVCGYNTYGYTYPNDTLYAPQTFYTNPYYYTINVAEYCSDDNLTKCVSTPVNSGGTGNFTKPALVRFCTDRALTNCKGKYEGDYKYPRFSDPNREAEWYGTITIGDSRSDRTATITSVSSVTSAVTQVITKGAVTASGGTNTDGEREALALALAKSIVDKTGLQRPFTACVTAPGTSGVPACKSFGITLASSKVLAVIPLACATATTPKANCTPVVDGSRAGDDLVVSSGTLSTALLYVQGSASGNTRNLTVLTSLTYGGATMLSNLTLARNAGSATVAEAIANAVGTKGAVRAVVGGTRNTSTECQSAPSTAVCFLDTGSNAAGRGFTLGRINNNNNLTFSSADAVGDSVPTLVTGLGAAVFVRTDIVEGRTYPKASTRSDCALTTCSYDEEMTNFANWYAFYKTRNQMMKTAVGLAFQPLGDNYNVGLVSLSVAAAEGTINNKPQPFTGQQRVNWYSALYNMSPGGATPVRQALHAVGKMYANQSPYQYAAGSEVVRYACQQNFTFVTTDGYWNGPSVDGVVSNDNKENAARFCLAKDGCVDTRVQADPSLADIALYWYNGGSNDGTGSLRKELENPKKGAVPGAAGDNTRLHMRTYTLGLGVDGIMTYKSDYDKPKEPGGDFYNLITGVQSGCPWNNDGPYVWPDPKTYDDAGGAAHQSRVDDLWHAAVNGRGKYFSASDPQAVVSGLNEALNDINQKVGAAASAATSTPNVSQEDRDIYSSTFTTVRWTGNLSKRLIDVVTGEVEPKVQWNSAWYLGQKVRADGDDRKIIWRSTDGRTRDFLFDQLDDTEKAWFANKCSLLSQCVSLTTEQRAIVNNGATIVNWLRGQQQYADDKILRGYSTTPAELTGPQGAQPEVLGDIATSKPTYLREPRKAYDRPGYADFKTEHASRKPAVFVAANDGMLHAFDAESGKEMWAYMPRITMKKLYKQAGLTYSTAHQYTTDGSPEISDVQINGKWRTMLVAGLNAGGRGYYALDVTDPEDPVPLWEVCADVTVCSGTSYQPEMGLSFGNAQFGTIRNASGTERWVVFVASGYNNIPGTDGVQTGTGKGFLFVLDAATGALVSNLGETGTILTTGSGSIDTPSGLAKITAISNNPSTDPLVTYVYGGDNDGKMWRFDFTGTVVKRLLMGDAGTSQPITTRPDVALCEVNVVNGTTTTAGTQRVVAFGTGRLLDLPDIKDTAKQSAYVLKDTGTTIAGILSAAASLTERTLTETAQDSNLYRVGGTAVDLSNKNGWFVEFDQNDGERVNLDPKIVSGTLTVVTNVPNTAAATGANTTQAASCATGGVSYAYNLDVCQGRAVAGDIAGRLLTNTSAAVGFIVVRLPSGALKMITTTADGKTITSEVAPAKTQDARRTGWRRIFD